VNMKRKPNEPSHEATATSHQKSFDEEAAALRRSTRDRSHTPAEVLQREGRDER